MTDGAIEGGLGDACTGPGCCTGSGCRDGATDGDASLSGTVSAVFAGYSTTCAAASSGALFCFGDGKAGQLGLQPAEDFLVPQDMMLADIREVAIGQVTVCVRRDVAPYVQCAGDGSSGQLGDGTTAPRMSFAPASIAAVTSLVAGWRHMVVRTSATQLHAWGNGTYGQLGRGDTDSSVSPVPIATALEQVTAGGFHTCGRRAGDGIECWGRSNEGQSGAASGNVLVPTLMSATNAQRYIDLSAGQFHTCAVRDDGSVECWGQNAFGQLGGMSAGGAIPVIVMDLPSVRDVECGYYHCCALTEAEGELWCWGAGDSGQLGGGVVVARAQAGRVMGLGAVTQFATGAFHTCAVDIRSQLWCWGANESGQLGTGNTMNSETPVRVNLD